jgi:3-deoxy-manno-octulosonate cytidylyltransferase (CMP-KDO synthetase)
VSGFEVVIPARFASTRLPGKPLAQIAGRPMIQWVYERALESGASRVTVATDDERIAVAVRAFGGAVCMTSPEHASGTDRIAETVKQLGLAPETVVVNLQGDEPQMPAPLIRQVATLLGDRSMAEMATACHAISTPTEFRDPHVVKVVMDREGYALYFSRAPVPWPRDGLGELGVGFRAYRHIGLYAYRADFIRRFAVWPACELERTESLEQLRALWHGARIAVCEAETLPGAGIDTAEDLERVQLEMAQASSIARKS